MPVVPGQAPKWGTGGSLMHKWQLVFEMSLVGCSSLS